MIVKHNAEREGTVDVDVMNPARRLLKGEEDKSALVSRP